MQDHHRREQVGDAGERMSFWSRRVRIESPSHDDLQREAAAVFAQACIDLGFNPAGTYHEDTAERIVLLALWRRVHALATRT